MKTCLLLGARGMLGSYLAAYLPSAPGAAGIRLACYDLPEIDICDPAGVAAVFDREQPALVINCAGYTNVDGAEADSENAFRVNGTAPGIIAQAAKTAGSFLVHISTDFVFDGSRPGPYRETDTPNPLCVYAASKLAGEKAIMEVSPKHLIVRTAWLYGPNGKNFVDTILALAREKDSLKVVDDQAGSPTFSAMLAEYLWKLISKDATGVYHVAGAGSCTWFDLAVEAIRLAGLETAVTPCTTSEFPRPADRPRNSALDVGKAERLLGEDIPNWRSALRRYLSKSY